MDGYGKRTDDLFYIEELVLYVLGGVTQEVGVKGRRRGWGGGDWYTGCVLCLSVFYLTAKHEERVNRGVSLHYKDTLLEEYF